MNPKFLLLFFAACLLCCSDDNKNPTYPFEKSVLDVSIVKKDIDTTLWLKWQHPIERKDLQSYYVWVGSDAVKDSAESISQAQMDKASAFISYSGRGDGDSLDLTDFVKPFLEMDSLHIAIWARYSGGEAGMPQHRFIYFGDDIDPSVIYIGDSAAANTIWIDWMRPTDQSDFYRPADKSGAIAGYNIILKTDSSNEDIRNLILKAAVDGIDVSKNIKPSQRFRKDGRKAILEAASSSMNVFRFAIEDGNGFDTTGNTQANNWRMEISGLKPEHSYEIEIIAFDISGNNSPSAKKKISTTDDTPPTTPKNLWFDIDPNDGLPRLSSNRLILFWDRSVDPPSNRDVKGYSVQQWNSSALAWEDIDRIGYGIYVSDTLRWIAPGEEIRLRLRAIDSSGYYSKPLDTTIIVSKGELWQTKCPSGFLPVKKDETVESVFCMEELQHAVEGKFEKNVLYIEAKRICEALSSEGFNVSLCSEQEWNAACNSGGSSYGVIEETDFSPSEFLYSYCGTGTGDAASAFSVDKRDKRCKSPDGIRDLPGQLQEWAIGENNEPILKGTSHAIFEGASRAELAQCKNRSKPTRTRPKYTTDEVYLYRTGSRIDTSQTLDTTRTLYAILKPSEFKDTILVYSLESMAGDALGIDYIDKKEYRRRGDEWLAVLWQGLNYTKKEDKRVLILGTESIDASEFFLDPTVGFRCCSNGL